MKDNNHGYLTFKGPKAKPFANHKVGTKVKMTAHGIIEAHEMQPDYENSTDEVPENAYPPKGGKKSKGPKMVPHTRVKILRTDDEQPQVQTPLDQVVTPDSQN